MNINSSLQKTPIAVIGLSAIFADAKNVEEFWENIITAKDSIKDVPANRWKIEDYYDEDMSVPDKTYCKRGGFLPEIDFNPMEFGLPPNILEVTDASQLLGLVAARDALEDAGYGKASERFTAELKEKTGVLLGVGGGQKLITPLIARLQYPIWEKALRASGIAEADIPPIIEKMKKAYIGWNENSFPGLLGNVISGRITNRFDLGGINSVVDAACAASLSAIKMSLSELVEGRCDMMLTGGVDTDNSPFMFMSFSKTPAFSKSGNISPFSDKADGMLIGEGLGMMVLKRLEDAERDGDRIYALIKGVGTSSDGRFKSVYAPRSSGQALAMNRAYEDAGFKPATVGLLEAHGTGTGAGDPTEFTSMNMVFGADNDQKQHIALGSVKSQIGHTKAAAGAAGMVKAILALHHKVLPPTINVEQPNSKFDIRNTPIYINTETRPWLRNGNPRRAGVSAFGFGGINVHLALEEYTGNRDASYRLHQPYKSVLLQASTAEELRLYCQIELEKLSDENKEANFAALIKSSKETTIHSNQARVGFVIKDIESCSEHLQICIQNLSKRQDNWTDPRGIYFRNSGVDLSTTKVAALFAGQGSQYTNMGADAVNAFPQMSNCIQAMDQLFYSKGKDALSKVMYPIPAFTAEEKSANQINLTRTQFAQPAIGCLSMGQYKVLQNAGFNPDFCAGHSFGELTALWAAGVYDDNTFLALAESRGAAMGAIKPEEDTGTMLAVKESEETVAAHIKTIDGVNIANVNAKNQVVIGGSTEAINQAEAKLKAAGLSCIQLPVSAAFHTRFVAHAQTPFADFVKNLNFGKPQIPVFANTTGDRYPEDPALIKNLLGNQLLNPVLFKKEIENLYAAGARVFVEFGPKGILSNLVKNILEGKDHDVIALNANAKKDSDLQIRQASVAMKVLGIPLKNIDPFKRDLTPLPPKSKMNVRLSGNNYVSKPTKEAYTNALNDGFKISGSEKIVEKIIEVEKIVNVQSNNGFIDNINVEEEIMNKETLALLKATLESFKTNQTKSLEIFERFMNEQSKQSETLLNILSSHVGSNNTYSNGNGNGHTAGFVSSNGNGHSKPSPVSQPIKPTVVTAPIVAQKPAAPKPMAQATPVQPQNNSNQTSSLTPLLLEVVSEKTGYPAEMLELNMDMEADLGIDSIKRVEIFAALTAKYPEMTGIDPNELTELRTLGEIVTFVSAKGTGTVSTATAPTPTPVQAKAPVQPTPQTQTQTSTQTQTTLTPLLLEVVSEKTGYPAEMLELNMDMEADLGIDSIKRVEIFAALTAKYPEMTGIDPNELTELRTLGEIVTFVSSKGTGTISTAATPTPTPIETKAPIQTTPQTQTSTQTETTLTPLLLEVVSEKTGYPAEMLELNMDMEADLGIDSIKRVEIFAALTSKYPEMSGIDPNELTELRTLGEIVSFVQAEQKKKELA